MNRSAPIWCLFAAATLLTACGNHTADHEKLLQLRIDSLQKRVDNSYKPGFGEFMSSVQVHHAKLWFAGTAHNWKLADFEIHELLEAIDGVEQYCTDRPETKSIAMIRPPIDSVINAIKAADEPQFVRGYTLLTNTCNNCHRNTQHEFNVIVTPTAPPLSNQLFAVPKQK